MAGDDILEVDVFSGQSIDLSAKVFTDWGAGNDRVVIEVRSGATSVIGSDVDDRIRVAGGSTLPARSTAAPATTGSW